MASALLEHETIEGKHVLEILQFGEIRSPIVSSIPPPLPDKSAQAKKPVAPAAEPPPVASAPAPSPA